MALTHRYGLLSLEALRSINTSAIHSLGTFKWEAMAHNMAGLLAIFPKKQHYKFMCYLQPKVSPTKKTMARVGIQEDTPMALLTTTLKAKKLFVISLAALLASPWAFACPLVVTGTGNQRRGVAGMTMVMDTIFN
ncbi:MAG: hypothetical protein EBZ44_02400 [Verrucomicrobia bacterium]|nr:hypothetical protein [Verrucomicrobiota bacterium]NDD56565.1 hypothetical protein [Verrucomicrobiota bacterium]